LSLRELIDAPGDGEGVPVFAEPWQAEAFAMAVALHERGIFTWDEWAQALSAQLKQPGTRSDGSNYYQCWLEALESLIKVKNIAIKDDIDLLTAAWKRAAHATPHGHPIRLENDPDRT
jgi:nitrile hydratase accessory protein